MAYIHMDMHRKAKYWYSAASVLELLITGNWKGVAYSVRCSYQVL
jgi:hypothetical protein